MSSENGKAGKDDALDLLADRLVREAGISRERARNRVDWYGLEPCSVRPGNSAQPSRRSSATGRPTIAGNRLWLGMT